MAPSKKSPAEIRALIDSSQLPSALKTLVLENLQSMTTNEQAQLVIQLKNSPGFLISQVSSMVTALADALPIDQRTTLIDLLKHSRGKLRSARESDDRNQEAAELDSILNELDA